MKSLWVVLPLVLLAGCGSDPKISRLCPQTAIVHALEQIDDYGGEVISPDNLVATANLQKVNGECLYKANGVDINFDLTMSAVKGPRLGGEQVNFPYFISIVDPDQKIISKEMLTANFRFSGNKSTTKAESLHVFIPMPENTDGTNYQVLAGFQFTEQQLAAARRAEEQRLNQVLGKL